MNHQKSEFRVKILDSIILKFGNAMLLFIWIENYLSIRDSLNFWQKLLMIIFTGICYGLSSFLIQGIVKLGHKAREMDGLKK